MKRFGFAGLSAAFGVLFFVALAADAAEVKGTVKKIDAGKNTVVITIDGKDKTFQVEKDASLTNVTTTKNKKGKEMEEVKTLASLSELKEGATVTLRTETVDDKEVVKAIKTDGGTVMAKKKKKDK